MKNEWSLIIFTLLIQLAVGSVTILSIMNTRSLSKYIDLSSGEIPNRFLLLILSATIIAIIISLFHLGNPFSAINSISNLKTSWLSREILFVILFSIALLIYFVFETFYTSNQQIKFAISSITAILGIALIYSMSRLYMLETVPVWNTIFTPVKFFLATLLLGIIAFLVIVILSASSEFFSDHRIMLKRILLIILILLLAELIFYMIELWFLKSGNIAEMESYKLIIENNGILFYTYMILFAVSIIIILYKFIINGKYCPFEILIIISVLVVLLQIIQRYLFYSSYERLGV